MLVRVDHAEDHDRESGEGNDELARPEETPVGEHEEEGAGDEPDPAAAGERGEVDEQQEDEHGGKRPPEPVTAGEPQVDGGQRQQRHDQHHP